MSEAVREPAPTAAMDDVERRLEALLFASAAPLSEAVLAVRLPDGADVSGALARIATRFAGGGVELVRVAEGWAFRTAADLGFLFTEERVVERKLSRAALETLAIVAYHQPVTRAEIEEIRGVSLSKGTLDVLMEMGWVKLRGRRQTPGRPVTYGTTDGFLDHFGLPSLGDLPGVEELKAAGLLDRTEIFGVEIGVPLAEGEDPSEEPLEPDFAGE